MTCRFCVRTFLVLVFALPFTWAARALTTPTNVWQARIAPVGSSSPAIGNDGTIYLGAGAHLWAVSTNGGILWRFDTGSEVDSSPAVAADGTIYFGSRDRKLYALTPKGREKWEFKTGAWVDSSPAIARDGTIYFGSWDEQFYALHPDGSLKWKFHPGAEIDSSPAIGADGTIYFGCHDKKFYALSPDGRKRWDYATGGQIVSSPALNGKGVIYFTSVDGFFYALNRDGTLRWRLRTGGVSTSSPIIGPDGLIYVGVNKSLWAITPGGKKKWEKPLGETRGPSPVAVQGGQVYYLAAYGTLMQTDEAGGKGWSLFLQTLTSATPAVGVDGAVYAPWHFSFLAALDTTRPLARTPWPKFRGNARNTGNLGDNGR